MEYRVHQREELRDTAVTDQDEQQTDSVPQ